MSATNHRSTRVLIVEDEEDCRMTLALLMSMHGFEVRASASGREAIAIAEEFLPEVVFLDLGMPLMDGYETAAALRMNARTMQARIVALTGYGAEREMELAAAAGFDLYLVKPAALADLLAAVSQPLPTMLA
ncbi:response regulator [Ramlibacter henchirensis]|nr:response regulator [Ramlibacter henchirensis]